MTDSIRSRAARALLLGAVLLLSAGANAREVRLQGPNGDGGACPEASVEAEPETPAPTTQKRAATREKAKATPMMRSGGDSTARPRWHSILPGMFR